MNTRQGFKKFSKYILHIILGAYVIFLSVATGSGFKELVKAWGVREGLFLEYISAINSLFVIIIIWSAFLMWRWTQLGYWRKHKIEELIDRADSLQAKNRQREAIKLYSKAFTWVVSEWREGVGKRSWQKKILFHAYHGRGVSYAILNDMRKAEKNFENALEFAPNNETKKVTRSALAEARRYEDKEQ